MEEMKSQRERERERERERVSEHCEACVNDFVSYKYLPLSFI